MAVFSGNGSAAAPSFTFSSDTNTGIFRAGADELGISTNAIERVQFGTSEVVFNDGGENYDFRIEGDNNANLFFVDASVGAVGFGTSSPTNFLHASVDGNPFLRLEKTTSGSEANITLAPEASYNTLYTRGSGVTRKDFRIVNGTTEVARIDETALLVGGSTNRARLSVNGAAILHRQSVSPGNNGSTFYTCWGENVASGGTVVITVDTLTFASWNYEIVSGGATGTRTHQVGAGYTNGTSNFNHTLLTGSGWTVTSTSNDVLTFTSNASIGIYPTIFFRFTTGGGSVNMTESNISFSIT